MIDSVGIVFHTPMAVKRQPWLGGGGAISFKLLLVGAAVAAVRQFAALADIAAAAPVAAAACAQATWPVELPVTPGSIAYVCLYIYIYIYMYAYIYI